MDQDRDPAETREWLDALDSVEAFEGIGRVDELLDGIVQAARRKGAKLPFAANTAYVNTISPDNKSAHPGDRAIEHRIRSLYPLERRRDRAAREQGTSPSSVGTSPASNRRRHFTIPALCISGVRRRRAWRRPDLYQGHCSPGIYARAFVEGRLCEAASSFPSGGRRRRDPSYPHPWLMPDFWQFPNVSMGLGP